MPAQQRMPAAATQTTQTETADSTTACLAALAEQSYIRHTHSSRPLQACPDRGNHHIPPLHAAGT